MDRIQLRRDSSARWAEINPILLEGEVGYEIDTKLRKIGDGVNRWNDLEYLRAEGISQETGDSENVTMSQKAITRELTELGSNVEKEEYIYVIEDLNGSFLLGIKKDGSVEWSKGVPAPVRKELKNIINNMSLLGDSLNENIENTNVLLESVDIESAKQCRTKEEEEYIYVILDSNQTVLFGIKRNGSVIMPIIPFNFKEFVTQSINEYDKQSSDKLSVQYNRSIYEFKEYFNSLSKNEYIEDNAHHNLSSKTKDLLYNLKKKSYGKTIMYGQNSGFIYGVRKDGYKWSAYNTPLYCTEINGKYVEKDLSEIDLSEYSTVFDAIGVMPNINSFDLGDVVSNEMSGIKLSLTTDIIASVKKLHSINPNSMATCSVHIGNPYGGDMYNIVKGHENIFNEILSDVGLSYSDKSVSGKWFEDYVNYLISFFNKLIDENGDLIPVLFRPFHEKVPNSNSGFWWCYCTNEEYIAVWKLLVDRIRASCNNVLFVISPLLTNVASNEIINSLDSLYPGDNYVDVIGLDFYLNNLSSVNTIIDKMRDASYYSEYHNKIFALAETGKHNSEEPYMWNYLRKILFDRLCYISYFTIWDNYDADNYYAPYKGEDNLNDYKKLINKCFGYEE